MAEYFNFRTKIFQFLEKYFNDVHMDPDNTTDQSGTKVFTTLCTEREALVNITQINDMITFCMHYV